MALLAFLTGPRPAPRLGRNTPPERQRSQRKKRGSSGPKIPSAEHQIPYKQTFPIPGGELRTREARCQSIRVYPRRDATLARLGLQCLRAPAHPLIYGMQRAVFQPLPRSLPAITRIPKGRAPCRESGGGGLSAPLMLMAPWMAGFQPWMPLDAPHKKDTLAA